ncbi:type VI secretion system baseplate subunit TssG [Jeongeupia naejangsanensis]|uniref:Type VI secretion system baseplate subunit TssG n=1 Tax=Jeongeupia naejangsanensis TaxID=613195 RepID=A0ABS2BL53_9NEIS|nr:type VI secretion system baseplate subunit TssG [Jeongeupia naejangsanensis]MBM3116354.1 type VI secretion system baseplate subunit TssG [Jeongeupia naejangsanensis]
MAALGRRPADSVVERLYRETHAFEFSQAVALLHRLDPDSTPPGHGVDPRQETVRLRGPLSPSLPTGAIGPLRAAAQPGQSPVLSVHLFGLGGPDGPLPYAYQEWLQARRARKDPTPTAFLDLFHQRLLGQLYRTLQKYRIAAPFSPPSDSAAHQLLRALTGLLPRALHERQAVPDAALLTRTSILANRRRSASGFQSIVRGHFALPLHIDQFDGAWSSLPDNACTRLGRRGGNNLLGRGALAGARIWDEQAGIRIRLGPMPLATYVSFLPGGPRHKELMALARFYFGIDMACRLVLLLAPEQAPKPVLNPKAPVLLGRTSWLAGKRSEPHRCILPDTQEPAWT